MYKWGKLNINPALESTMKTTVKGLKYKVDQWVWPIDNAPLYVVDVGYRLVSHATPLNQKESGVW